MLNFVLVKFLNMMLNGVRGIALASVLGPREYGIFGTLIVLQQYLSYAALGMREGLAIHLARLNVSPADLREIYSSAVFWGAGVGVTTVCVFLVLHFGLGMLPSYFVWIGLVSLASILNEILININRHESRLGRIAAMEFLFQASVLALVLTFSRWLTVTHAVQAMFIGLVLGLSGYFATMRLISVRGVSWRVTRELVRIGILPAVFSAVVIVFNSYYVLLANWMKLGEAIGLVVFGSNISMMILFGLNTVSWALASKSMARLYAPGARASVPSQTDITDVLFRLGTGVAVLIALAARLVFSWMMQEYAGSADFILYFCLFQSYGLLLFSESNFLNVNSRLPPVLLGYLMVMLLLGVCFKLGHFQFLTLLQLGVAAYYVLAVFIAVYARHLGFSAGSFGERLAALSFPAVCVLADIVAGEWAVAAVCAAFLLWNLTAHRERTAALAMALIPRRTK